VDQQRVVYTLLEDREGVVWLGTDDGLIKLAPSAFMTFDAGDGLPEEAACFAMAETSDGALWFGFWGPGVYRMGQDRAVQVFGSEQGLHDGHVGAMQAVQDEVWVFSLSGLGVIRDRRYRALPLPDGVPADLSGGRRTADGLVYVISFSGGMFVLDNGEARRIGEPVGAMVNSVLPGPEDSVWAVGEGWGAVRVRHGQPELHLTQQDGLPSNHVNYVLEDAEGTVWVATDRGLWRRSPGEQGETLDLGAGLGATFVYWIAEEMPGVHWFGTNRGVVRRLADGTWQRFTFKDGLGSDECNERGVLVDSSGRVFISTTGVSVFVGSDAALPGLPPPVYVASVRAGGQLVDDPRDVTVPARRGPVTFSFVSPSFIDETRTRFRYRLVGLADDWTTAAPGEYSTTYGGLRHGRYRFEVMAHTSDGRASPVAATAHLLVTPRWWQLPLARVAGVAVLCIVALLVLRLRERRHRRARLRLERQVAERTNELAEANRRLAELAVTDELTGLANRRAVLDTLRQAVAYARRHGEALTVALIDVDHFKPVNDRFGHEAGDRVLRAVADAMRAHLRAEDTLGRYGGDEFLAVLPGTDASGAGAAGERLRASVTEVQDHGDGVHRVTVSVGVCCFSDDQPDVETLVSRADQAMYQAKRDGRNRVVMATPG
jgi:diguanylate cyclase (GGDEF)-like protein